MSGFWWLAGGKASIVAAIRPALRECACVTAGWAAEGCVSCVLDFVQRGLGTSCVIAVLFAVIGMAVVRGGGQ